jgi:glucan biosynthesis protein C
MFLIGLSHQFRLHSLFLISGAGTWFAFRRRGLGAFLGERLLRLGVPLVFATLSVNLLMAYMLTVPHRPDLRFAAFAMEWLGQGGLERVQHLWFILVLLIYSLALGPVFALLRRFAPARLDRALAWCLGGGLRLLVLPALPFVAVTLSIKPWAAGESGAGYTFWLYGLYFLVGYLIMRAGDGFLHQAARIWPAALLLGLLAGVAYLVLLGQAEAMKPGLAGIMDRGGWAMAGGAALAPGFMVSMLLDVFSSWWLTVAAFGLAARYLNRASPVLAALTRAVYPFYVLHMIFVAAGVLWAAGTGWPWGLEFLLIVAGSYTGCWLGYLLLEASPPGRFLFGIKPAPTR